MATSEDNFETNDFEVVKGLGGGSFGRVYLVKHYITGELLARKEINLSQLPDNENARARTLLEVDVMKQLDHKHIMAFRYHVITVDYLYIYTEYCSGEDLQKLIVKLSKFALPEKLIVCWLSQIVDALKYLHDKRILHRDLKPDNIYLAENADIKLGDFGIARTMKPTEFKIETMIGTPIYMSPEILSSQGYNQKTDVWSLGCVIYELATTNRAFNGISYAHIVFQVVLGNPPSIPDIYSNDLVSLNSRMMIKTPEERPSADEIMEYEPVRSYLRKPYKPTPLFKAIISFSDKTMPLKTLSQSLSDEHPKHDLKKIVKTSGDYTKEVEFEQKPKNNDNEETVYESAEFIVNEHTKNNVKQTVVTSDANYMKKLVCKYSDDEETYINLGCTKNNTRSGVESGYERDGSARRMKNSSPKERVSDDDYEETYDDVTNKYPKPPRSPLKYQEYCNIDRYEGTDDGYGVTFDEYEEISDENLFNVGSLSDKIPEIVHILDYDLGEDGAYEESSDKVLTNKHPKHDFKQIVRPPSEKTKFERKPENSDDDYDEFVINEDRNVKQTVKTSSFKIPNKDEVRGMLHENYVLKNKARSSDILPIQVMGVYNIPGNSDSGWVDMGVQHNIDMPKQKSSENTDCNYRKKKNKSIMNFARNIKSTIRNKFKRSPKKDMETLSSSPTDTNNYEFVQDSNPPTVTKDERRNFLSKQIHDLKRLCVRGLGNETFEMAYRLVKQEPHSSNLEQKLKEVLKDKNDEYHGHIVYIALFETLLSEIK